MRIATAFVCLLAFVPSTRALAGGIRGLPAPTGEAVVPKGAKLELLFTRTADIEGGLTEGPAVAPDGSIYFTDIPFGDDKGMILRFDPKTKKTTVFAKDSHKANGLIFNAEGFLLACEGADGGGRCVAQWNVKTGKRRVLAPTFTGKRFNAPNDLCLDSKGRIYFTDPRYVGDEPRELKHRAVYRIDPDGTVALATDKTVKPNGIAISPDGKTLYVANHDNGTDKIDPTKPPPPQGVMNVAAFQLNPETGEVTGGPKVFVDFKDHKGCDGMCVDADGNVYLTIRDYRRPGVWVYGPKGKEIAHIPTGPEGQESQQDAVGLPSNVEFGLGGEISTLFVTVDKSLYRVHLKTKGFQVQHQ